MYKIAELLIVNHLDVPGIALLVGRLVGNDGNAGLLGALEHRFQGFRIVGDHRDQLHFSGNQIFDHSNLLSRISGGRPEHGSIKPSFFPGFFDAFAHRGEPGNAADLHDHGDIVIAGASGIRVTNCVQASKERMARCL